jgi:hypothetical protein
MVNSHTEEASKDPQKIIAALTGKGAGAGFVFKLKDHISMGAEYAAPSQFVDELTETLQARSMALNAVAGIDPKLLKFMPGDLAARAAKVKTHAEVEALLSVVETEKTKAESSEGVQFASELETKSREEKLRELHDLYEEVQKEYKGYSADIEAIQSQLPERNKRIDAATANVVLAQQAAQETSENPQATEEEKLAKQKAVVAAEHTQVEVVKEEWSPAVIQAQPPAIQADMKKIVSRGLGLEARMNALDKGFSEFADKASDATLEQKQPNPVAVGNATEASEGNLGTLPPALISHTPSRSSDGPLPQH